ncbi:MAG: Lrp/AsnC family transcriptional regulator [Candidatus Thorarchaeota archaeon]|nr:MAG: Lrp/AsnC family transcriptional regulator [Candidatus Thorarchaeota archaeon]
MSSRSQRPVSRRSATTVFYSLALGSGIMRTFSVVFDIFALNTVTIDALTYGFLAQWTSFVVTFLAVAFLSIKRKKNGKKRALGYSIDPDFDRIRLLPRKPMLYIVISGVFAGISTLAYYVLAGSTDASTILPYGQLVIIYLLIGDLMAEKDTPTIIEIQSIISILIGVLLVGATPGGFDILTLLIVLGPLNISSAMLTYYQRKTKRYELRPGLRVDSLNMRVWSLFVLNLVFGLFSVPFMSPTSWQVMASSFVPLSGLMIGTSITAFFSIVMYVRALGRGSMAVVNSLSSISVVLAIPMTIIGNLIIPGAFGLLDSSVFFWTLTMFGVILVMIGVIALEASDVRSLVLIKVKPQTGDLLPRLFDINGVEKAAALAGPHDYILTIKSRNLAKTRSMILKRIQKIPGIADVETLVTIKDYR